MFLLTTVILAMLGVGVKEQYCRFSSVVAPST